MSAPPSATTVCTPFSLDFEAPECITTLKTTFRAYSQNGRLTKEAFYQALHELGIGDDLAPHQEELLEIHTIFSTFDPKETGSVDIDEMATGLTILFRGSDDALLDFAFSKIACENHESVPIENFLQFFRHYFSAKCALENTTLDAARWDQIADHLRRSLSATVATCSPNPQTRNSGRISLPALREAIKRDPDHPFTLIWQSFTNVRRRSMPSASQNSPASGNTGVGGRKMSGQ